VSATLGRCPGPDLLLLLAHGLLDDAEAPGLEDHLEGCPACRELQAALAHGLAAPPDEPPPEDVLARVERRLAVRQRARDASAGAAAPAPTLGTVGAGADGDEVIRLRCTYCRDALQRGRAVYCAECLAPQHGECFGEHGRCTAPGCEGAEVVRAAPAPTAGTTSRRRTRWQQGGALLLAGLAAAGGAVAAAALAPSDEEAPLAAGGGGAPAEETPAGASSAAAGPAPAEGYVLAAYAVADLLDPAELARPGAEERDWQANYRRALAETRVDLVFERASLADALDRLRLETRLNFTAPRASSRPIDLALADVPLAAALDALAVRTGLEWSLFGRSIRFHEPREGHPPLRVAAATERAGPRRPDFAELERLVRLRIGVWPSIGEVRFREPTRPARLAADERLAVADLLERVGARAWPGPTFAEASGGWLVVLHTAAGHAGVEATLARLRAASRRARARAHYWFAPAPEPFVAPADARIRRWTRELLDREVWLRGEEGFVRRLETADSVGELLDREVWLRGEGRALVDAVDGLDYKASVPVRVGASVPEAARRAPVHLELSGVTVADALALLAASHGLSVDVDRRGAVLRPPDAPLLEPALERIGRDAASGWLPRIRSRLAGEPAPPEWLAQVRVPRPLDEALAGLEAERARAGRPALNAVVPRDLEETLVSVADEGGAPSLGEALEDLLAPGRLGLALDREVAWVVPQGQATERAAWSRGARSVLARPLGLEAGLVGATLADLASRVEAATDAHVVLTAGARRSRGRLALPAGLDVGTSLDLAARQVDLSVTAAWLPGGAPVLVLDAGGDGPLAAALERLEAPLPGDGPAPLRELLAGRRELLADALQDLANRGAVALLEDDADDGLFWEVLGRAERAWASVRDVELALADLERATPERVAELEVAFEERRRAFAGRIEDATPSWLRAQLERLVASEAELRLERAVLAHREALAWPGGLATAFPEGYGAWRRATAAAAEAEARATLWVTAATRDVAGRGVEVRYAPAGSPLAEGGLRPGDRIVARGDGAPIRGREELADLVAEARRAGATLELEVDGWGERTFLLELAGDEARVFSADGERTRLDPERLPEPAVGIARGDEAFGEALDALAADEPERAERLLLEVLASEPRAERASRYLQQARADERAPLDAAPPEVARLADLLEGRVRRDALRELAQDEARPRPAVELGAELRPTGRGEVEVASVEPGSLAARGGLEPGDLVLKVGRRSLSTMGELLRALPRYRHGDVIPLVVLRGDATLDLYVLVEDPARRLSRER